MPASNGPGWLPVAATVAIAAAAGTFALALFAGLPVWIVLVLLGAVIVAAAGADRWVRRRRLGRNPVARLVASAVAGLLVIGALVQVVPYGRAHANPPVRAEPAWDDLRTRELAERACFDCHSNEVDYPWYAWVAPFSWAVEMHVDDGRRAVNFSEWDHPQEEADESAETVREGEMPPAYYLLTHPDARLTDEEERALVEGLAATLGDDERSEGGEDGEYADEDGSSED